MARLPFRLRSQRRFRPENRFRLSSSGASPTTTPLGAQRGGGGLKRHTPPTTRCTNRCSMTLRPCEIVLIRIDYHQTSGGKVRPAAVLLDSGDDDFVGRSEEHTSELQSP